VSAVTDRRAAVDGGGEGGVGVAESGEGVDATAVMPVSEVAQMLAVPVSRVHQMVRDGQLLSVRREGTVCVPADFFDGGAPVKGLSGTIVLLRDGGYTDPAILRWMFADDPSLPGTPIVSLRAGRHREVKRRAQAMAF
jgi:hypothetical protein